MKKILSVLIALLMLTGCAADTIAEVTTHPATEPEISSPIVLAPEEDEDPYPYESRFDSVTRIEISDHGITVNGGEETAAVFTSHDIVYYEDRDTYESGNPYGEGEAHERHTAEEAAVHTVINITAPGAYSVTGTLSAGQIRVDLGEDAYYDPDAVVELCLNDADITCTVAPAILFLNTYECDGSWSVDTALPDVDTSAAGANLILSGCNRVSGSHVARIYKDADGEKKLWKQDGAIYSYMSMNVFGPGILDLTADNEGMDTELHLTINGGNIRIYSGNDGINTNEDGVSVTTINHGILHIVAGLGAEGDGIDSNGYLVINGGRVVAFANPAADAGLDSDLGSYVNGGTVIALGSAMDWAESDSGQVTMNLQFARMQSEGSAILVTDEDETPVFAYAPTEDELLGGNTRQYSGVILSCPGFRQGATYHIYTSGTVTGQEECGIYAAITAREGFVQMQYGSTDVTRGFGGRGDGQRPVGEDGEMPPDGFVGERPGHFGPGQMPEEAPPEGGFGRDPQGNGAPPENSGEAPPPLPEGETFPEGEMPGGFGGRGAARDGSPEFYMQDMVNMFSGLTPMSE